MQGLDFATTKVLLIGASEFHDDPQIVDIPNVAVNIEKLYALLQDTEIMGIPEANITKSLNESKLIVEKKLNRIVKDTNIKEHTLIVYYSGHGMYSNHDFRLYLTTSQTTEEDLEASAINGDRFKEYIGRSNAGRKIVILDCCHSGKLLNSMGSKVNNVEVLISTFEGTYVMASSASDEPSLFPKDEKERPTYFTEKLLETINGGLENKSELCSLHDVFCNIERALVQDGRPRPQQSVYKSAGEIGLCKNKKFVQALPDYEVAWQKALEKNSKWVYDDYIKEFENSIYVEDAISKLEQLEDEERWQMAKKANTLAALRTYLHTQKNGRYRKDANTLLNRIQDKAKTQTTEVTILSSNTDAKSLSKDEIAVKDPIDNQQLKDKSSKEKSAKTEVAIKEIRQWGIVIFCTFIIIPFFYYLATNKTSSDDPTNSDTQTDTEYRPPIDTMVIPKVIIKLVLS